MELHKVLPGGGSYARDSLRAYRLLEASDADFAPVQAMLFQGAPMEWSCDSALGMVLGNVVGDAIGAPLELRDLLPFSLLPSESSMRARPQVPSRAVRCA